MLSQFEPEYFRIAHIRRPSMNDPLIRLAAAQHREGSITWTGDAKMAKQFSAKREARDAARIAGGAPAKIDVMGFELWALVDDHGRYITETGFAFATNQKNRAIS